MFANITIKRLKTIKNLRVEATEDGGLLVKAPTFVSDAYCMEFIKKNSSKIGRMVEAKLEFAKAKNEFNGFFLHLGKKAEYVLEPSQKKPFLFEDNRLTLRESDDFRGFLLSEAKRIITPKAHDIAGFYNVEFKKISFRDAKSRWGSCTSRGHLNFSYRLVGAPKSVIEYVVIHEVCHLRELNHSERFWNEVRKLSPAYKESEAWLQKYGRLLFIR